MKVSWLCVFFFLQLTWLNDFAQTADTLFIAGCRDFALTEFGKELTGSFFTETDTETTPYYYLYVSLPDTVATPFGNDIPYTFYGTDKVKALSKATEYRQLGYHTLCYGTNANSGTAMNQNFLFYPKEAQAFIIFHELTHNYLSEFKIQVPYEFNESLCDVIGNYGALKYAEKNSILELRAVKHQTKTTEKIYHRINTCIDQVNKRPEKEEIYYAGCYKRIQKILKGCNQFQKDRLDYKVNNAYLLRNLDYCKNYFFLKKVLNHEGSIRNLLEVMKHIPIEAGN